MEKRDEAKLDVWCRLRNEGPVKIANWPAVGRLEQNHEKDGHDTVFVVTNRHGQAEDKEEYRQLPCFEYRDSLLEATDN